MSARPGGADERLKQLDAEIRRTLSVGRQAFGELVRAYNKRDDLLSQYDDRRHPPDPERRHFLETRLGEIRGAIAVHERQATECDDRVRELAHLEARLTAEARRR